MGYSVNKDWLEQTLLSFPFCLAMVEYLVFSSLGLGLSEGRQKDCQKVDLRAERNTFFFLFKLIFQYISHLRLVY